MLEELVPMVVSVGMFGSIAYIPRVLSDNRVKRELVNMKADRETIDYLILQAPAQTTDNSLKWGIVSVALGAALAVIHLLGLDAEDPMTWALTFIFGGGGLLAHYALTSGKDG